MNEFDNLLVCLKLSITPEMYEGVENLVDRMKKYHEQLLDTRHELVELGQLAENQKHALELTKVSLERYEQDNKALKTLLVSEWA